MVHCVRKAITITTLALLASAVSAQSTDSVTLYSRASPIYLEREHQGCLIAFDIARFDPEYHNNKPVHISGNLGLHIFNERLLFKIKLGLRASGEGEKFSAPEEVFLLDGYQTNSQDFLVALNGESGFRAFFYEPSNLTIRIAIDEIVKTGQFSFFYAMESGGLGAVVNVDTRIERLKLDNFDGSIVSERNQKQWLSCVDALITAQRDGLNK